MAIKKLTLTSDHIKLIKAIKFEAFQYGELFSTAYINDAIQEIESSVDNMKKFGSIRDKLITAKEQMELVSDKKECMAWGINQWSLFGGTYAMEDIALVLGCYDKYIPGTEEDRMGKQYPKALEDYMWGLYDDIVSNMEYIGSIIFQFLDNGGIVPGVYQCKSQEKIWEVKEFLPIENNWEKFV